MVERRWQLLKHAEHAWEGESVNIPRFLQHIATDYPGDPPVTFPSWQGPLLLFNLPWYFAYSLCFTCSPVVRKLLQAVSNKYCNLVNSPALRGRIMTQIFPVIWIMRIINTGNKWIDCGNQETRYWRDCSVIKKHFSCRRLKFALLYTCLVIYNNL